MTTSPVIGGYFMGLDIAWCGEPIVHVRTPLSQTTLPRGRYTHPLRHRMAVCHPERPHQGKGRCTQCYSRAFYLAHRQVRQAIPVAVTRRLRRRAAKPQKKRPVNRHFHPRRRRG